MPTADKPPTQQTRRAVPCLRQSNTRLQASTRARTIRRGAATPPYTGKTIPYSGVVNYGSWVGRGGFQLPARRRRYNRDGGESLDKLPFDFTQDRRDNRRRA